MKIFPVEYESLMMIDVGDLEKLMTCFRLLF